LNNPAYASRLRLSIVQLPPVTYPAPLIIFSMGEW
jgi:hypothetical protein